MKKLYVILLVAIILVVGCGSDVSNDITENPMEAKEDGSNDQILNSESGDDGESPESLDVAEKELESAEESVENTDVIVSEYYDESGVWYEIFVRGYADSDGDGIGDFKGISDNLDFLNDGDDSNDDDLGINGIWLMPINPSPSYHGYDVTDYYEVNGDYGTMEDFENLVEEAHKRGIKVIMDLVLNHSSSQHPYFQDAVSSQDSPYRDYYRFADETTEGINLDKQVWNHNVWHQTGDEYYYGIFWDQMPDLNYDNQVVRDEMINVAAFWLKKGVDGFRIDAVSHVFGSGELKKGSSYDKKTDEWWNEFNYALREVNPDYYLVGEAWEPIKSRAKYSEYFDTTFNFDLAESAILGMVKNEIDLNSSNNGLVDELNSIYGIMDEKGYPYIDALFLTNHDQRRAMDYLKSDVEDMKMAAGIYLTLPGNPFIYYGEEIGMLGNKPDENIREPYIWGNEYQTNWKELDYNQETISVMEQESNSESLLNYYKELIHLRQDEPALLKGDFEALYTSSNRVVAYSRKYQGQSLVIVHNLKDEPQEVSLDELNLVGGQVVIFGYPTLYEKGERTLILPGKSIYVIEM